MLSSLLFLMGTFSLMVDFELTEEHVSLTDSPELFFMSTLGACEDRWKYYIWLFIWFTWLFSRILWSWLSIWVSSWSLTLTKVRSRCFPWRTFLPRDNIVLLVISSILLLRASCSSWNWPVSNLSLLSRSDTFLRIRGSLANGEVSFVARKGIRCWSFPIREAMIAFLLSS